MFNFSLLVSAVLLLTIDFVYLTVVQGYFRQQIQRVQNDKMRINYFGAALCYVLLIAGLNYFIIKPRKPVSDAFLLGIVIYGVYETTNYALLSRWSLFTVIMDTLWGGALFAITTYLVRLIQ